MHADGFLIFLAREVDPKKLKVIAGAVDISKPDPQASQTRSVSDFYIHPNFAGSNKSFLVNDIGILKLDRPFDLTVHVDKIEMLKPEDDISGIKEVTLTGYGSFGSDKPRSSTLQYARKQIVSREECGRQHEMEFNECIICAGVQSFGCGVRN